MNSDMFRRNLCIQMLQRGVPRDVIAKSLHMSSKTITALKSRNENEMIPPPTAPGRPSLVTDRMMRFMDNNWAADASISDEGMMRLVNQIFHTSLSRTTIMRCRNRLKYRYRPPRTIQQLTDEQRELRVIFCDWVVKHPCEVKNLLFTDESRFQKGPDNRWRRIKRGVVNDACFDAKVKFPDSIMMWGGIAMNYRTPLVRCSNGVTSDEYIRILDSSGFINEMNSMHGQGNWKLLQDGASCHTSEKVLSFLESRHVCVVAGWPPNSPDLNPIEMVWGVMKRRLGDRWKDVDDLGSLLIETWNDLHKETFNNLVDSFMFRCELVLRLGGSSATPDLASHRPLPDEPRAEPSWSDADDRELERHVADHGHKWSRIGALMDRRPNFLKRRWACLQQHIRNDRCKNHVAIPSILELDPSLANEPLVEWLEKC